MPDIVDIAIVGGGPAGLTAALYGARARARTVVFETGLPGGQIVSASWVENYPGFPDGISGDALADLMVRQAQKFGAEFRTLSPVEAIRPKGCDFVLTVNDQEVEARTVILATGAIPKKLGVPGEAEFSGRGVSWCATCDGPLYRDKVVAVVGGGDSATQEALFLTKFATEVHLVHRRDELRATPCIQEQCFLNPKITMHLSYVIEEILGEDGKVTGVRLRSKEDGSEKILPVDGVFMFVGIDAQSALIADLCELDEGGFVKVDHERLDIAHRSLRGRRRGRLRVETGGDRLRPRSLRRLSRPALPGYEDLQHVTEPHRSILSDRPETDPDAGGEEEPAFFADLNLGQVVDEVVKGREEYRLKTFFYAPLLDAAAVAYRQEVARDLEQEEVFACVETFTRKMQAMREHLAQAERVHYQYQKTRWFFDAAEIYGEAVGSLADELNRLDLKSRGLIAFLACLRKYLASDGFVARARETRKVREGLTSVKYCVRIRNARVRVTRFEGEADYSAEVEETFAKFKQGAAKDYLIKPSAWEQMDCVEARVSDFVMKLYPDVFRALDEYCAPASRLPRPNDRRL